MSPSWDTSAGSLMVSLLTRAKATLTHCANAGLVFETMKESIPDLLMFFVHRRHKPVLKTLLLWNSFSE